MSEKQAVTIESPNSTDISQFPIEITKEQAEAMVAMLSIQKENATVWIKAFAAELRKWWRFDEYQKHTHSWHTREDFIEKMLPKLLTHPYGELKPLEWYAIPGARRCDTAFGRYLVDGIFWWGPGATAGERCESVENGKQLCQSDYERRVAALFKPIGGADHVG